MDKTYSGHVAIIGRPNVGKSTLLNKILGQKISITARKQQTTRHRILGIKTENNIQAIYVDTPGIHKARKQELSHYLNRAAKSAIFDVDLIVFVIDAFVWREEDDLVLEQIKKADIPVVLAVNKVDKIKDKEALLPFIDKVAKKYAFAAIIPLSAQKGENVPALEKAVASLLPEAPFYFSSEQITDKSVRFLCAEIVREKLTRLLGQEVPHELTVVIESFVEEVKITRVSAVIYVERQGQKAIVIGEKGERLKEIGTKARIDMEKLLQTKVFLQLWVKVKKGWTDDKHALTDFGYTS